MSETEGLQPGDEIRCGHCDKVILVCVKPCPPESMMKSENLTLPDGTPLGYQAVMECHLCGTGYFTIMTKHKVTVPYPL